MFYTKVIQYKNKILHVFYDDNNKKRIEICDFNPKLGLISDEEEKYKDIFGNNIKIIKFKNIDEYKKFKYEEDGLELYNDINLEYQFISERYKNNIVFSKNIMKIFNIDIEVDSRNGLPFPEEANYEIQAVTIQEMNSNKFIVYGLKDYENKKENIKYIKCKNEEEILKRFIQLFEKIKPDILTGWNILYFDIPYLINRMKRLKIKDFLKLSPIQEIKERKDDDKNIYEILGVTILDYIELYKKFEQNKQESYSLNSISKIELGDEKVNYDEFEDLNELYEKDFKKFIEYNIKDVELVWKLDKKLKYIDLILSISYMVKCNYEDCFGTVKLWDIFLFNRLFEKNILIPPIRINEKKEFPGGFVLDPKVGMTNFLTIYDIKSSYPNAIRSYNISPETIIPYEKLPEELKILKNKYGNIENSLDIVDKMTEEETNILKKYNVCLTSSGNFFSNKKYGIVPEIVSNIYEERVRTQKLIKEYKKENKDTSSLEAKSYALKILLNSLYGAFSNIWFRWFDIRIAETITSMGQTAIRSMAKYLVNKYKDLEVVAIDTDSLFINLEKIIEKEFNRDSNNKKILDFILKFQEEIIEPCIEEHFNLLTKKINAFKNTIKMENECISDRGIITEKKHYILKIIYKDGIFYLNDMKLKIKGIEVVRTSTPEIVRKKLKEVLELILKGKNNFEIIDFIKKFKKEFLSCSIEEISFPRSIQKGLLEKYNLQSKSLPIHVRGALIYNKFILDNKLMNKYELIKEGEKIKFCYIKEPNIFNSNVLAFKNKIPDEIKEKIKCNYELQFEKTFISPLEKIFEVLKWNFEKNNSLENLFF